MCLAGGRSKLKSKVVASDKTAAAAASAESTYGDTQSRKGDCFNQLKWHTRRVECQRRKGDRKCEFDFILERLSWGSSRFSLLSGQADQGGESERVASFPVQ